MYFQLFSIHGLVRHENMELGRDADTGGQVKYVVELAKALSQFEEVRQVDLFTRLIEDKRVSPDYAKAIEPINDKCRIVRIQCGGKKYMRKELLWPHLDEFIDKVIKFIKREKLQPDVVHGHYPDAGYVGIQLSEYFGIPFIFTGHSLGRPKKQKLLNEGMNETEINKVYHIDYRIEVEEEIIKNADQIITSTQQEIEKQYGMYLNQNLASYKVFPPGIDVDKFYSWYHELLPDTTREEEVVLARGTLTDELNRFLLQPDKPLILALCRADKRKNISGLVKAYGTDKELQAVANLAIFAGIRRDISAMEENEKDVLTRMLLLMDKYDLYGKMAIPKKHDFTYEVPELYRIAAEKKGVFVNIALTEPFGITLIEASACGLPIVATNDGGPKDIIKNCKNGILVDPLDTKAVVKAIKKIIVDPEVWRTFSANGIKGINEHYRWEAHVEKYLQAVKPLADLSQEPIPKKASQNPVGGRLTHLDYLLITDIDNTLIGDPEGLQELSRILNEKGDRIGFGVATGRHIDSAIAVLQEHGLAVPDILITSVGSEIHYRDPSLPDRGWGTHIAKNWNREKIQRLLDGLDFLEPQAEENQRRFKISYDMDPSPDHLARIHELLVENKCYYNLIYSHGKYLDILPHRASKGKAIRYLSYKWEIPVDRIAVSGDSGNDEEMLKGSTLGIVVGNYAPELERLKGKRRIYFSPKPYARGIIDGLVKYGII